jgi:5'-nucleotidase
VGDRVTSVEIRRGDRYEPLDESRVYVVAVPEFLYYGGDGFHFKDRAIQTIPPGPELELMAFDAIAEAYAKGEGVGAPVEGRIARRGAPRD